MEIYLSHMAVFRIVEKLGLNHILGNGWMQYVATVVVVLCETSIFAVVMQKVEKMIRDDSFVEIIDK